MSFTWGAREEVSKNREQFLRKFGLAPHDCVAMRVMHGSVITPVQASDRGKGMEEPASAIHADALVTTEHNVILFLLTGDCLPLVIHDPRQGVIALAHVSRFNAAQNFGAAVVGFLAANYGCAPGALQAEFGPAIRKESYVLSLQKIHEQVPNWDKNFLFETGDGAARVDLPGCVAAQMRNAGMSAANIFDPEIDTARGERFFSHYRVAQGIGNEGRIATFAGLK